MENAIYAYISLAGFAAIALVSLYHMRKKKPLENYGGEHKPFIPKSIKKSK